MNFFDFDCKNILSIDFKNIYKSPFMKELLDRINSLKCDNSLIYIYGDRGTEKNYLVSMIIKKISNPYLAKIEKDKDHQISKHYNAVYLINNPEEIDFSFLFDSQLKFKCAIFLSESDYEFLFLNNKINYEKYDFLKKAEKFYIPPLRERKQDIIPLANIFLSEISMYLGLPRKELSKEAKEAIVDHNWSENCMELKYCLTKACILSKHKKLNSKDIFGQFDDRFSIKNFLEAKIGGLLNDFCNIENSNLYDTVIQEVEKALFSLVLSETGNNQLKASKILGINRNTLSKKLKNYNLI